MDVLIKQVSQYVERLFQDYFNPRLLYHNIEHTINVVRRADEICKFYHLSAKDYQVVTIAAWFHDVRHLISGSYEHERKSVSAMKLFLICSNIDETTINKIADCIMSTKFPSHPQNLLQMILCDADTYHLGTEEFWQSHIAIKREVELMMGCTIDGWDNKTLFFLQSHQFFTDHCKNLLTQGKTDNLMRLSKKIT
ncbi:MAG: HD domain-containing protein [Chitinophagaceae bacterium]|nr:HD domain-containing protein [Chitinophagaceae bacterium]